MNPRLALKGCYTLDPAVCLSDLLRSLDQPTGVVLLEDFLASGRLLTVFNPCPGGEPCKPEIVEDKPDEGRIRACFGDGEKRCYDFMIIATAGQTLLYIVPV